MELEFKPDYAQVLKRFEAWWHCELVDRPLVSFGGKKADMQRTPKKHATTRDRWMDMEYQAEVAGRWMASRHYFGEALPIWYPNVGPEVVATLFGAELEFGDITSWSKPIVSSCREILKLKLNFDNPYWNAIRKGTALSLEAGKGKWITGLTDLHTNGDLLASLRDPEQLCMDLADDLDSVRAACDHVTDFYEAIYNENYAPIAAAGHPSTSWTPCVHQGRGYVAQCDFICMISPDMFRQTILPSMVRENTFLERTIFHLDGPGAIKHLDVLMEEAHINGIQWVYTAGTSKASEWIPLYQRVQKAGKCMQIICTDLADAQAVAKQIKPQGAWFCIGGDYTPEQAKDVLTWFDRWSAGKE